jgi:DNA helicase-2/ATP-dependent DNA helicase PcrA
MDLVMSRRSPAVDALGQHGVKHAWLAGLPNAAVTGRGLLIEHQPEPLDESWWPGHVAARADGRAEVRDEFTVLVLDPLHPNSLRDPARARNLLRAATVAIRHRRPILAPCVTTYRALKRASRDDRPPWELDAGDIIAGEEFVWVLGAWCAQTAETVSNGDTGRGAVYLTPIERRVADSLDEAGVRWSAQVPVGGFVADFLVEDRLVVECDGAAFHDPSSDRDRDRAIAAMGYPTLRLSGRAIHADAQRCIQRITRRLHAQPVASPPATDGIQLTPAQEAGVLHRDGPAMVVAPAGSGKTRVVAERIRRLIADGADPTRICAISFTKNAVDEMRSRVDSADVKLATLNSLAREIVSDARGPLHPIDAPGPPPRGVPRRFEVVKQALGRAKVNGGWDAERNWWEALDLFRGSFVVPKQVPGIEGDSAQARQVFLRVHAAYEALLREHGVTDFNGQIIDAIRIVADDPKIRLSWSKRFDYWIVDEYQDLPIPKLSLVRLLTSPARSLMVVGDDDQIIYGYAGATPLTFSSLDRDWRDIAPVPLDRNFRCPHDLVVRSGWLVSRNLKRVDKNITPQRALDADDNVLVPNDGPDRYDEHALEFVKSQLAAGRSHSDIALLFRTKLAAAPVEARLSADGVPYKPLIGADIRNDATVRWVLAWLHVVAGTATPAEWRATLLRPTRYLTGDALKHLIGEQAEHALRSAATDATNVPRSPKQTSSLVRDALVEFVRAVDKARRFTEPGDILTSLRLRDDKSLEGGQADGKPGDGDTLDPNVAFAIIERLAEAFATVAELDSWLNEEDTTYTDHADNKDAVVLLTIHRAKGMEWPAVAILGPDGSMPDSRATDVDELEEERRIAYVGVTRAVDTVLFAASKHYAAEMSISPTGVEWGAYKHHQLHPETPETASPARVATPDAPAAATVRVTDTEPDTLTDAVRWLWGRFKRWLDS